jgi:type VI secretion system protein ImpJ
MNSEPVKMQMANLNISLKLGSKIPENYLVIPVAEISEYVSGASVVLNKAFVPQCLDVKISGYMQDNINLIYDKLQGRIYQISSRMNNSNNNKSYQSMIRDYMWMSALG